MFKTPPSPPISLPTCPLTFDSKREMRSEMMVAIKIVIQIHQHHRHLSIHFVAKCLAIQATARLLCFTLTSSCPRWAQSQAYIHSRALFPYNFRRNSWGLEMEGKVVVAVTEEMENRVWQPNSLLLLQILLQSDHFMHMFNGSNWKLRSERERESFTTTAILLLGLLNKIELCK